MNREKAVKDAMASVEMEGFAFTEEEKALFDKLAKGEIDYTDFFAKLEKNLEKLKKERPEILK